MKKKVEEVYEINSCNMGDGEKKDKDLLLHSIGLLRKKIFLIRDWGGFMFMFLGREQLYFKLEG